MKILIADDERESIEFLKNFLERKGYSVDIVFDGKTAVDLIEKNDYDLAFLDHNMPELTGLEVAKFVRDKNLKTKTIMLTGYPEMEDFFAKSVGVDEYINKPCRMEDIQSIIDKYGKQT